VGERQLCQSFFAVIHQVHYVANECHKRSLFRRESLKQPPKLITALRRSSLGKNLLKSRELRFESLKVFLFVSAQQSE
jgi:hypothetical protein